MTNYFIENSINAPPRCGWVDCKNIPEPGTGRCMHHKEKPREPYIGMRMKTGKRYIELHDRIYQAYNKDPSVVNDQAVLFGTLFEPLWDYSLTPTENLIKLPRDSNVCRRRQELHEAGLIEYSKRALKRREEGMRNERDKASPMHPVIAGVDFSKDLKQASLL